MLKLFGVFAAFVMAGSLQAQTKVAFASLGAKVKGLRFFPSSEGFPLKSERVYPATFDSATSKYINMEIELEYPKTAAPATFTLACSYAGPAGAAGTPSIDGTIQAGWTGSYHAGGWGTKTRGTWSVGRYQVTCGDGVSVVASGSFSVTRDRYDVPEIKGAVVGFRFFEGPETTPELSTRKYSARFEKSTARWIRFELSLDYSPAPATTTYQTECRYDYPDGRSFSVTSTGDVQQGWSGSYLAGGFGYPSAGLWPAGNYTVTCRSRGVVIAQGTFEVY